MNDSISFLLSEASKVLEDSFECELLLSHALGVSRSYLYTWPEKTVDSKTQDLFHELLKRRVLGEPIAYILSEKEFWSLPLRVTPDTLIPRPETELLVEKALEKIPKQYPKTLIDLGTGSGAIALALAKERPECILYGVDSSFPALLVAKSNQETLKVSQITWVQSHWLEAFQERSADMIISNPPYIQERDSHLTQGDLRFEPQSALQSGLDGLQDIRLIVEQSTRVLKSGGWLIIEHGYDQQIQVEKIFQKMHYKNILNYQDVNGLPRVTQGQLSK